MLLIKKSKLILLFSLLVCILCTSCSNGVEHKFNTKNPRIALVVSGPVNDSSWNSAAYIGLKRFEFDNKNVEITVIERVSLHDARKVFTKLARSNYDLIIGHGYQYSNAVLYVAKKYLNSFFAVVGGEVSQAPNVCSFNFKNEQYGYLVGIVAGLNTSTNKVGIVIGKKVPSVEKTIIGIRKGLKTVNPKADLVVSYINTWTDINKGREAAVEQINTGVDVITHLADLSGVGVLKAAEEADISAIGAIVDQHDLAPTTVISSGIQDTSQLIYLLCQRYIEKTLRAEVYKYGLKDQIIDLSPSYGNIDPTNETRINRYKSKLTELEVVQEEAFQGVKE